MRILQVVRSFDEGSGAGRVAVELQKAWIAAGVDSRVLASMIGNRAHDTWGDLVVPGINRVPTSGGGRYIGKVLIVPIFTIAATLKQRRFGKGRLVVSHGEVFAGDVCVIHAVNNASLAAKRSVGSWKWMLNPLHHWTALRDRVALQGLRYRRYVAISTRVAQELKQFHKIPEDRIAIIPNGVDIEKFTRRAGDREAARAAFGIPEDAKLLIFVGHEFERKGLSFVIDALAALPPEVRLLVIGGDTAAPFQEQARRLGVEARITFAGRRRDVERLYPAADVFVFPTYYEAFPLVCLEAMAAGLPVFATRVGGIEDCLVDGVNGAFVTRDGADIAHRLQAVFADPALLPAMSRAAHETTLRYTWPVIADRYLALFRALGA